MLLKTSGGGCIGVEIVSAENAGARPAGYLKDLDAVQASAVLCLRKWGNGEKSRKEIEHNFSSYFGNFKGTQIADNFDTLCECFARYARRSLVHHHIQFSCLGADEACFANFIGYSESGNREEAMLLAATFVRLDIVPVSIDLAQNFFVGFKENGAVEKQC